MSKVFKNLIIFIMCICLSACSCAKNNGLITYKSYYDVDVSTFNYLLSNEYQEMIRVANLIDGLVEEKTLYDVVRNSAIKKIKESNDCLIEKNETIPYSINIDNDMAYEYKNSYIISLNNSGLTTSQWKFFTTYVQKATMKNLVLVLKNPIEKSCTNSQEQLLFEQVIKDKQEEGINVTIIYFGDKTGYTMYNGIKQFTINNKRSSDLESNVDNDKYIRLIINDDEVTYQVKSIYE